MLHPRSNARSEIPGYGMECGLIGLQVEHPVWHSGLIFWNKRTIYLILPADVRYIITTLSM
jgi:hypothetical protein